MPLQGITRIKARTEKKICQLPKTAQSAAGTEVAMIAPRPHLLAVPLMDEHMQYKGAQAKESSQRREVDRRAQRTCRRKKIIHSNFIFVFPTFYTAWGTFREETTRKDRHKIGPPNAAKESLNFCQPNRL